MGRHWPSARCTRKERAHVIPDQYLWLRSKGGCWIAYASEDTERPAVNIYNMIVVVAAALEKTRFAATYPRRILFDFRSCGIPLRWLIRPVRAACVTRRRDVSGRTAIENRFWFRFALPLSLSLDRLQLVCISREVKKYGQDRDWADNEEKFHNWNCYNLVKKGKNHIIFLVLF